MEATRRSAGSRAMSLLKWVSLLVFAGLLLMMAPFSYISEPVPAAEERAVGWLRIIYAAGMQYESIYKNGYAPSLKALGPEEMDGRPLPATCTASDLLESMLASGNKDGYLFTYAPGVQVKESSEGCPPGVESYTVTARPIRYGTTGTGSFWMDQAGVIRQTRENRPATATDPAIE